MSLFHLKLSLLLITMIGQAHLAAIQFRDCGNGEIESIRIEPCAAEPCHFEAGQRANMTITFVPRKSASSLYTKSTLRRGGLFDYEIDVPDQDNNICRDGNSQKDWGKVDCPIEPMKRYTFVANRAFPVSTSYNVSKLSKQH